MYDQRIVMFVHEYISQFVSELDKITTLYINDMASDADNAKKKLMSILKTSFGPFLSNNFYAMEKMLDDNTASNMKIYPVKLRDVEKAIINQYKRLEIQIQGGMSQSSTVDDFKILIGNINRELVSKLQDIENEYSTTAIRDIEQNYVGMQAKVNAYFVSIGLITESICLEIKQIIDIHQSNLLDKIEDKIPALTFLGVDSAKMLFEMVIKQTQVQPVSLSTNNIQEIPMFKI